jgi:hypothetical protein
MKLRSSARILKKKALSSMRLSVAAFNSMSEDGRATSVLLHVQHSFEMLLKASLNQAQVKVFDPKTGRSLGFEAVVRQAQQAPSIKLTDEEAGTLRAIDAMRDDEQHWYNEVDEGILFLHVRAAVTLFDDLMYRVFAERLADHLPRRILPISVEPPQDFQILVDREYANIAQLLQPGRRAGAEARARIRTLLAMEAHNEPDTKVSDTDVSRVEKGIRAGKERDQVFPRLSNVGATISGAGPEVQVRMVKKGGLPVTYVSDGSGNDVAAIRTVDLQKKYHRSATELAAAAGLTRPRAALRAHLGIDTDPNVTHTFHFGSQRHIGFSDNALSLMKDAKETLDMTAIWLSHRAAPVGTVLVSCGQAGCASARLLLP